jgi:hypothetical protein
MNFKGDSIINYHVPKIQVSDSPLPETAEDYKWHVFKANAGAVNLTKSFKVVVSVVIERSYYTSISVLLCQLFHLLVAVKPKNKGVPVRNSDAVRREADGTTPVSNV